MKEKIKKFLIPWREDLDKKWWHRLINVFIYGSTISIIIFLFVLLFTGSSLAKFKYTYSFDPEYPVITGEEFINCKLSGGRLFHGINCDNFSISLDDTDFGRILLQNNLDNMSVKKTFHILYFKLFSSLGIIFLITLGWFIFWESIVYRIILYIIYGRNQRVVR